MSTVNKKNRTVGMVQTGEVLDKEERKKNFLIPSVFICCHPAIFIIYVQMAIYINNSHIIVF